MLISIAHAAGEATDLVANGPDTTTAMISNIGVIVVLVIMFYFLLIRPQQKRFKEHKAMIDALKKGDKVVTAGGLIGTVDKIVSDEEVIVDLGNKVKVSVQRHMVNSKMDEGDEASEKSDKKDEK